MQKNKISSYFLYAIGEIVLVVIGILLALSLNNWQLHKNKEKLEARYVANLIEDLEEDSVGLLAVYGILKERNRTKYLLLDILNEKVIEESPDSILSHFRKQWMIGRAYYPRNTTFREMTSSAHLGLLKDNTIREEVVTIYSQYDDFSRMEEMQFSQGLLAHDEFSQRVPNLNTPKAQDILALKDDYYMLNKIMLNGSNTRTQSYENMISDCLRVLQQLKTYQSSL